MQFRRRPGSKPHRGKPSCYGLAPCPSPSSGCQQSNRTQATPPQGERPPPKEGCQLNQQAKATPSNGEQRDPGRLRRQLGHRAAPRLPLVLRPDSMPLAKKWAPVKPQGTGDPTTRRAAGTGSWQPHGPPTSSALRQHRLCSVAGLSDLQTRSKSTPEITTAPCLDAAARHAALILAPSPGIDAVAPARPLHYLRRFRRKR